MFLFDWWRSIVLFWWFRPPRAALEPAPQQVAEREPEPVAVPEPEPVGPEPALAEPEPEPKPNRATRRAADKARRKYERARMKHDKWVTPGGQVPAKVERAAPSGPRLSGMPGEPEADARRDPNDRLIVGELIEGDGTEVLFEESEFWEFNFRDSILDQLDRYWVYLKRMKAKDPDAYGFYKLLGAVLVPRLASHARLVKSGGIKKMTAQEVEDYRHDIVLPPWFKRERPAFGCVAIGADPLVDPQKKEKGKRQIETPRFIYFVKYEQPPPEMQMMVGGDIYKITVWWDDRRKQRGPTEFGVFVSKDGETIQVLRMLKTTEQRIKCKHKLKWFTVSQREWRIPDYYSSWAGDYGLDASTHLAHIFAETVRRLEWTDYSMIRVRVTKGTLTAVFGVNIARLAYFFRDRDVELNEHGLKKRIFHLVRPHVRSDGVVVKMHFRGSPEFDWAGYHVKITVPGRDHFVLSQVDIGSSDAYWFDKKDKVVTEPEFAQWLHERMEAGVTFNWHED